MNVPAWLKSASAAAMLAILCWASSPARALTVVNNGDQVDGWDIVFPSGLTLIQETDQPTLTLQVMGAFNSLTPQDITFVQATYTASPTITFATQTMSNSTGNKLIGLKQSLHTRLPGNTPVPTITGSFNLNNPARTVFTTKLASPSAVTLNGPFKNGMTSLLGFGVNGGNMVISANPVTSGLKKIFMVKETPLPVVPIPPAAWTGLSGLLGLGAIAGLKRLKKVRA